MFSISPDYRSIMTMPSYCAMHIIAGHVCSADMAVPAATAVARPAPAP
jgi:hypothetical protein